MGAIGIDPAALGGLELFAGVPATELGDLASRLAPRHVARGETLMRQGEPGDWFALVSEGEATISLQDPHGTRPLGRVGPGSILGELALLRTAPRSATVIATTPLSALTGDVGAFAVLLGLTGVRDRLTRDAVQKLAAHATPVEAVLGDGTRVHLRPVLPSDRQGLEVGISQMSPESLRRRFFSAGAVPEGILRYLVDLDYVRHFAWLALLPDHPQQIGIAMARYVRSRDDPSSAEIAVGIIDAYHRRGLGTLLVGALAAAASTAGIMRFSGEALEENVPIRRLLDRVGARWTRTEPGVLTATVEVADAGDLIDAALATRLAETARATISAADIALA